MPFMQNSGHPLRRLYRYSSDHKLRIYAAFLFSVLNKIFDLAPPLLIGIAVDIVVQQEDSFLSSLIGVSDPFDQLVILGVLTLVIWVLESFFDYLSASQWKTLSQIIEHELRIDSYAHLQTLDMEYFEDRQVGGLMAVLNDDVNQLERFLDIGANTIIQIVTTVIVISTLFIVLSPFAAIFGLIPMPFVIIFSIFFQKKIGPKYEAVRSDVSALNGQLSNNLSGIVSVKSFTAESIEVDRITNLSDNYQESNKAAIKWSASFAPLIRMIIVVGFTSMLIFAGIQALNGSLAAGTYSVMIFLTQRLLWPLTRLGETSDQYQRAMASSNRVFDLLDAQPTILSGTAPLEEKYKLGPIVYDNVTFGYRDRLPVLTNFSAEIPAGSRIAFVGATGSGKTTLIKLLLRFYETQSGTIYLGNTPISELQTASIRKNIGLISQDVFLFDGTVRENIAYGELGDIDDEKVIQAAKLAECHSFVSQLPEQYHTVVGERGQKLSGGQRQRISIARAIYKNPPILIFDEATSSVDNETEASIQRSIESLSQNRTMILIAHRLSTIRNCDHIFVLKDGVIIEEGRHETLLENSMLYASLWNVQTGVRTISSPA